MGQCRGNTRCRSPPWSGEEGYADFAAARYRSNGSLDPTFGSGGTVLTDFGSVVVAAGLGLALQPDGKIVAAGERWHQHVHGSSFALARYRSSGSADASFGAGGRVMTSFRWSGSREATASDVVVEPGHKVLAVGSANDNPEHGFFHLALARYLPPGKLDPTFGSAGKVLDLDHEFSGAEAAALQRDGRLVAAGWTARQVFAGDVWSAFLVARYLRDGSLDPAFGSDGRMMTTFGLGDGEYLGASDLVLQPDGKLIAAGQSDGDIALVRYLPDGSLDPSFGPAGVVLTPLGSVARASALALQQDGKIVVAGTSSATSEYLPQDFVLARYLPDGSLDPTFGSASSVPAQAGRARGHSLVAVRREPCPEVVKHGDERSLRRHTRHRKGPECEHFRAVTAFVVRHLRRSSLDQMRDLRDHACAGRRTRGAAVDLDAEPPDAGPVVHAGVPEEPRHRAGVAHDERPLMLAPVVD